MSSLADRLDIEVEGWRPEPGDKVLGTVVELSRKQSDYNDATYPYIEIEKDDGSIVGVHGFHTTLKNEIDEKKPKVGDTLGIKYLGKRTAKRVDAKGKPVEFEAYKVVHEPKNAPAPAPDEPQDVAWGDMGQKPVSIDDVAAEFDATEEPF